MRNEQHYALVTSAYQDAYTDCRLNNQLGFRFMLAAYQTGMMDADAWHLYQRAYAAALAEEAPDEQPPAAAAS
jgi:hypothetical protein